MNQPQLENNVAQTVEKSNSNLEFQIYNYDVQYNPKYGGVPFDCKTDQRSRTASSKEAHRAYVNAVRGLCKNGSSRRFLQKLTGSWLLVKLLNAGFAVQFCITEKSTEAADVLRVTGCFADYDAMEKQPDGTKKPFPNVLTPPELLELPTVKEYAIFYQESFSGSPNYHIHFEYDREVEYSEHVILLRYLNHRLNEEKSGRGGVFDDSITTNSTHVCYAGKTDCVELNFNARIPVGEWLEKARSLGITSETKKKYTSGQINDEVASEMPESPLEYLERVIGKGVFGGNWHLWFDKHPNHPGDKWVTGNRGREDYAEGYNPFSPTDSSGTGFFASKKEDKLPPTWACTTGIPDGCDKTVVGYNYLIGRMKGKYLNGGFRTNFRRIVNNLCDEYGVPKYDWNKKNNRSSDVKGKLTSIIERLENVCNIRFNELTKEIEKDSSPISWKSIRGEMEINHGIVVSSNSILEDAIYYIAEKNRYHPIRDYLFELLEKYPASSPESSKLLNSISTRYFKTTKSIYDIYLKKHLIAAVARIMEPGCPVKQVIVLQGEQSIGKSYFIRLISKGWLSENFNPTLQDKDVKLKINSAWHHEIGEIDQYFRKTDRSAVKDFVSSAEDCYREPYARETKSVPRMSVFWGTTNDIEILNDPTGAVRFCCIPIGIEKGQHIDFELLKSEIDILWAEAFHCYLADNRAYFLTAEETIQQEESNKQFENIDPWEEMIMPVISQYQAIPVSFLYHLVGIEKDKINKSVQNRLVSILKSNNWRYEQKQTKINNRLYRLWFNPHQAPISVKEAINIANYNLGIVEQSIPVF